MMYVLGSTLLIVALLAAGCFLSLGLSAGIRHVIDLRRRRPALPPSSWDVYLDTLAADIDGTPFETLIEMAERRASEPDLLSMGPAPTGPAWDVQAVVLPPGMTYQRFEDPTRSGPYTGCDHLGAETEDVYAYGSQHPVHTFVTACPECDTIAALHRAVDAQRAAEATCGHHADEVTMEVTDPDTGEHLGYVVGCPRCYEDVNSGRLHQPQET